MESKKQLRERAHSYMRKGMEAYEQEQIKEAENYAQNALHLALQCADEYTCVRSLNLLGDIYGAIGNVGMAVDCYFRGQERAEKNKLRELYPIFYNNIGTRYLELLQPEKAEGYLKRSLEELQNEECSQEEYYPLWMTVTLFNLTEVYCMQKDMEQAEKMLVQAKKYMDKYQFGQFKQIYLTQYCTVCWSTNRKQEVYQNLDKILEEIKNGRCIKDYIQNVKNIAVLLEECGEHQKWEQLLKIAEEKVENQENLSCRLLVSELWMDYYQKLGKTEEYVQCCIAYTKLCRQQKKMDNGEKATALDMRIALYQKEKQWLGAEKKASIDALTRLQNRYGLERDCKEYVHRYGGSGQMLVLGILDVDYFKLVNDTYGHVEGDSYLRAVAKALEESIDGYGNVYRFGGDEFVILTFPGSLAAAERVAAKVHRKLEKLQLPNEKSPINSVLTMSQGYVCMPVEEGDTMRKMMEQEDKALYMVKESGKDYYYVAGKEE